MDMEEAEPTNQKAPTPRSLFVERMRREGREKEWFETVKKVMTDENKRWGQAAPVAMKLMGYETPDKERQLHAEYQKTAHLTVGQKILKEEMSEVREVSRIMDFEEAVRLLPDRCSIQEEIEWIRSHPAMVRMNRNRDKTKEVLIDANDILRAPHGKAPSKASVYQLQHWANHPNKFYEMLLSEQKKGMEEGSSTSTSKKKDVGLSEIEAILKEVSSGCETPISTNPV